MTSFVFFLRVRDTIRVEWEDGGCEREVIEEVGVVREEKASRKDGSRVNLVTS